MADHDRPEVPIPSRAALRAWLTEHHATLDGAWLVRTKKSVDPNHYVSQGDVARECLCFGWIDSKIQRLDDRRTRLQITPRRPGSPWSRVNKALVAELEAAGQMAPAGRAALARAKDDGSWTLLDSVEALEEPDDLAAALDAAPGARAAWATWPDSVKKGALWQVKSAKRAPTRARRIAKFVAAAAAGERPL